MYKATQLNVESDSIDVCAIHNFQLQSVSCVHMDDLEKGFFNIQEILQSLRNTQLCKKKFRIHVWV